MPHSLNEVFKIHAGLLGDEDLDTVDLYPSEFTIQEPPQSGVKHDWVKDKDMQVKEWTINLDRFLYYYGDEKKKKATGRVGIMKVRWNENFTEEDAHFNITSGGKEYPVQVFYIRIGKNLSNGCAVNLDSVVVTYVDGDFQSFPSGGFVPLFA